VKIEDERNIEEPAAARVFFNQLFINILISNTF